MQGYLSQESIYELIPDEIRESDYLNIIKELMSVRTALFPDPGAYTGDLKTGMEEGRITFSLEMKPLELMLRNLGLDEDLDLFSEEDVIFEMELSEWNTDQRRWPKKRAYAMFRKWFEVVMVEDVYNLVPEPLSKFEEN